MFGYVRLENMLKNIYIIYRKTVAAHMFYNSYNYILFLNSIWLQKLLIFPFKICLINNVSFFIRVYVCMKKSLYINIK